MIIRYVTGMDMTRTGVRICDRLDLSEYRETFRYWLLGGVVSTRDDTNYPGWVGRISGGTMS